MASQTEVSFPKNPVIQLAHGLTKVIALFIYLFFNEWAITNGTARTKTHSSCNRTKGDKQL